MRESGAALRFPALAVIVLVAVACSTKLSPKGVDAFHRRDYATAETVFAEKAGKVDKDYVLHNLALLSAAIHAGDWETAEQAGLNAHGVMFGYAGGDRGVASLVSAEAIKVFKGEPFEKAMASIYLGILYFNRGDYDNARASFGKAVMAVQMKDEKERLNFALPYLLQAKVFLKLGDTDNARIALERARVAEPGNPFLDESKLRGKNVLFFVELGRSPVKFRTGPGKSLADWRRADYPERSVEIFLDGLSLGRASLAGDLTVQAQTKGWTAKDTVQVSKGVARDAAVVTTVVAADQAARGNKTAGWVALGAGLFALANQSQADTRQWELLPDLVAVLPARIPTNVPHDLKLVFRDGRGVVLGSYTQEWRKVLVERDMFFIFRSGPFHSVSFE